MNISKFIISDTEYLQINPECIHEDECETCTQIDIDYINEKTIFVSGLAINHFVVFVILL